MQGWQSWLHRITYIYRYEEIEANLFSPLLSRDETTDPSADVFDVMLLHPLQIDLFLLINVALQLQIKVSSIASTRVQYSY